ncbi:MAG TPA: family 31 glucosidase, partial [Ruminiclostridium sp.]|nr:family 31 glucosidase [Ruminiclostridium sp.]
NHSLWTANSTKQIDYIIIAGDTPAEIMSKYADLTGHAPKFPRWASGFWQSKLRYEDQDELLGVAREYKRRGIPLSAIVIDYFHWPEQGEWKLDPKYWPDTEGMCKELN